MQAVQPKMAEIKEKFKDNQQKQNEEMAKLYKKEGVNPLGGCLPLLAQFPFFLAMYGLFNNHFDLRGATFIRGGSATSRRRTSCSASAISPFRSSGGRRSAVCP